MNKKQQQQKKQRKQKQKICRNIKEHFHLPLGKEPESFDWW